MNNIKRKEIDEKVFQEICTNEPEGFNQIKRSINKGPRAVSLSLKRLTRESSLIIKNSKGLYCLSPQTRDFYLFFPSFETFLFSYFCRPKVHIFGSIEEWG